MYWISRVDGELTSVNITCVGEAPACVSEQAKVAKVNIILPAVVSTNCFSINRPAPSMATYQSSCDIFDSILFNIYLVF